MYIILIKTCKILHFWVPQIMYLCCDLSYGSMFLKKCWCHLLEEGEIIALNMYDQCKRLYTQIMESSNF